MYIDKLNVYINDYLSLNTILESIIQSDYQQCD